MENCVRRLVRTDDRGDIIGSWLIRVTLGLAVAGVVLFDAISIGSAKISLQDTAQGAAREAVDATAALLRRRHRVHRRPDLRDRAERAQPRRPRRGGAGRATAR